MNIAYRDFCEKIEKIRSDRIHGATFLAQEALGAFKVLASSGASLSTLVEAAVSVANSRPMMAAQFRVGNELLHFMDSERSIDSLIAHCDTLSTRMKRAPKEAAKYAADYISGREKLLTHSYSSAVRMSIERGVAFGNRPHLFCTESRPANEGRDFADVLCRAGVDTTLIVDAVAPYLCGRVELVLLGADGIGPFGLVHKIGTYAIALAAKEYGVEVAVVADSMKFWPSSVKKPIEPPKSSKELADGECFDVLNLYFDVTPLKYIDTVITEEGILDSESAAEVCQNIELHHMLE